MPQVEESSKFDSKPRSNVKALSNENEIIRSHDHLIRSLAARFLGAQDRKDIEQIGRMALIDVARRWDSDRAKLWTFARPRVFGAMLRYATKRLEIEYEEVLAQPADAADECMEHAVFATEPNQETAVEIADLIGSLGEKEKSVIRLSLEGKGIEDIAAELGSSKSEVFRAYQRAVRKMQKVSNVDL